MVRRLEEKGKKREVNKDSFAAKMIEKAKGRCQNGNGAVLKTVVIC